MIFKISFQHKPFYDSVIVPRMRELGLQGSPLSRGLTTGTMHWEHIDFHVGWKHVV